MYIYVRTIKYRNSTKKNKRKKEQCRAIKVAKETNSRKSQKENVNKYCQYNMNNKENNNK